MKTPICLGVFLQLNKSSRFGPRRGKMPRTILQQTWGGTREALRAPAQNIAARLPTHSLWWAGGWKPALSHPMSLWRPIARSRANIERERCPPVTIDCSCCLAAEQGLLRVLDGDRWHGVGQA